MDFGNDAHGAAPLHEGLMREMVAAPLHEGLTRAWLLRFFTKVLHVSTGSHFSLPTNIHMVPIVV